MKVVAIIQARMGSSRLPGKVLKEVNQKPLLEYELKRLKKSKEIDQLVIATTNNSRDEPIIDYCKSNNISFFRGSENDVLSRYYEASVAYKADIIVRLTSDCPIIDFRVVDKIVNNFKQNDYDYVSNTLKRTYPRGMDTEVFSLSALEKAHNEATKDQAREHVTPYIYMNNDLFNIFNIETDKDNSSHRWTVDTEEDYLLICNIIDNFKSNTDNFSMEDVLEYIEKNPHLKLLNKSIEQKKLEL